jgi:hypothetical protein
MSSSPLPFRPASQRVTVGGLTHRAGWAIHNRICQLTIRCKHRTAKLTQMAMDNPWNPDILPAKLPNKLQGIRQTNCPLTFPRDCRTKWATMTEDTRMTPKGSRYNN